MNWFFTLIPLLLIVLITLAIFRRRSEVIRFERSHRERLEAKAVGSDKARLQYPDIDLSQCIGCGACVRACPEEGVIELLHGQAVVVHGARCVGHGLCAAACPTATIALTMGDLSKRTDMPAMQDNLEAVNMPGLFLAGELSGFALVRTAVKHGTLVADTIHQRLQQNGASNGKHADAQQPVVDLLIVGAGPAGLACALRCKELGVRTLIIEQTEEIGGTVASYPRRKMVMTQPMRLPLHGRLSKLTYQKEELVSMWEGLVAKHELSIRFGVRLTEFQREDNGEFVVETTDGTIRARNLCLALGRRGTPRKLGVPGEDSEKVAYNLIDAESFRDRKILVVGGGDSAVEAAIALAEQPGNAVTLSYRKKAFFRLKAKNNHRLQQAIHDNRVSMLFESQVTRIDDAHVDLSIGINGESRQETIPNDDIFVFAGGIPPFKLLEEAGVSFDPQDHPAPVASDVAKYPLMQTTLLVLTFTMSLCGAIFSSYYSTPSSMRSLDGLHHILRPSGPLGLSFGIAACLLMIGNLMYLARRSPRWGRWMPGSLRHWMTGHIFTGVAAFMLVVLHGGFTMENTVGGHAFIVLSIVIITGMIGRYIYAFVPRAVNGKAVDLDDASRKLEALSTEWDAKDGRGIGAEVHEEIDQLIQAARWQPRFLSRVWGLLSGQFRLWKTLRRIRAAGRRGDVTMYDVRRVSTLARRTYRLSLWVTHYEEIRSVLASWRYFHRWLALLMVLLAAIHIFTASRYADLVWPFAGSTEVAP